MLRENGLAELELEREDFRVRLRREGIHATRQRWSRSAQSGSVIRSGATLTEWSNIVVAAADTKKAEEAKDQDLHIITSPIVGTFYRSPSPAAEPFVKIGTNVEQDSVVCIIEAMKLMNEIQAEAAVKVVKIYVENGQPVEYGQPLFGIRS